MELTWGTSAQKQVGHQIFMFVSQSLFAVKSSNRLLLFCSQVCLPSALTASMSPRKTSWKLCGKWRIQRSWSPSWTTSLYKCVLCHILSLIYVVVFSGIFLVKARNGKQYLFPKSLNSVWYSTVVTFVCTLAWPIIVFELVILPSAKTHKLPVYWNELYDNSGYSYL